MINNIETWKPIEFDFEFTNQCSFEVSNLGNVRSFNKASNGNILKGSITEGYRVIRTKFYKPRTDKKEQFFIDLKSEISDLTSKKKELKETSFYSTAAETMTELIQQKKEQLSEKLQKDLKKRTINHAILVHRAVATCFLPKPKRKETVVGHIDHDKLNNRVENLKWMTPEENKVHQFNSPAVIAEKKIRQYTNRGRTNGAKLTVTQVMHLKMLLQQGKPIKQLVKQFKISEMQVSRIKKGENWAHVKINEA